MILTGTQAAAEAARLSRVQVVAAYPITPQSKIPEVLSAYVERGDLKAEFVRVESEHSAMGVCIAASIVGARSFTATAANGLAYMHEQLHWAAGARLPIVMPVTNRGMGAPWTILNDTQDSISQRDTGWMQFYCMNNQEVIDLVIVAFKAAEQLLVPCMVCFDGFRLSHTLMPVNVPEQEMVDRFLPPYVPFHKLDPENPMGINPVVMSDPLADPDGVLSPGYMGFRARLQKSLEDALPVIRETGRDFGEIFSAASTTTRSIATGPTMPIFSLSRWEPLPARPARRPTLLGKKVLRPGFWAFASTGLSRRVSWPGRFAAGKLLRSLKKLSATGIKDR